MSHYTPLIHSNSTAAYYPEISYLSSPSEYSYPYTPYASTSVPATFNPDLAFGLFSHPPIHDFCNAPLVAPIPLPYHSPTFLQFELPDLDQDLSHPPYTRRASKRKRVVDEVLDEYRMSKKRGVIGSNYEPHPYRRVTSYPNLRHPSPVSGKRPKLHCHT
ncbi:hypothetical protein BDZ94DRAFT_1301076 [Collybia nuda]|uniref:Uncharacterized protein n=1 Tax=Collybia nuda TaxID=64659 RepID=A0A9P5XZP6_9AGAR|nr:hypothetical protein BDZ94DRAFT_1301076 [Collybia nuda]